MNLYPLLKNILYHNLRWLRGLSSYPIRLIPRPSYLLRIDIDKINANLECSVVRRAESSFEETFNAFNNARQSIIPLERIPKLSMNLLGGSFLTEDIKYRTDHEGSENWNGEPIFLSDFQNSFEVLEANKPPIFFGLGSIHNKSIPYKMDVSTNKEAKKFALSCGNLFEGSKANFIAKTVVNHSPTKLNYWHVELDIQTENTSDGVKSIKGKSTWQQEVCETVLTQILVVNASAELVLNSKIPRQCYLKKFA